MKNIAVILAAGSGSRFASDIPKQYVKVKGKMILEYALEVFQRHPFVDEIMVAVQPLFVPLIASLKQERKYPKLSHIIIGGKERYETTWAILKHCRGQEECNLLLHDGVRPFIDANTLSEVITALHLHEVVVVAVPATDTLLEAEEDLRIRGIPDRQRIWQAQTPQGFRLSTLERAFQKAIQDPGFQATDESSVVFRYLPETPIQIIPGSPGNVKITYPEDLKRFDRGR